MAKKIIILDTETGMSSIYNILYISIGIIKNVRVTIPFWSDFLSLSIHWFIYHSYLHFDGYHRHHYLNHSMTLSLSISICVYIHCTLLTSTKMILVKTRLPSFSKLLLLSLSIKLLYLSVFRIDCKFHQLD